MADTWELTKYVESHPDNHKQRWRLVKKLYKEGDYRMALENIQILVNDWDEKPNVCRYLAATYTRLSRYDEAVRALEYAVDQFPVELDLREQLAVAYAETDDPVKAAETWSAIAEASPDHPFAAKAARKTLERMHRKQDDEPVVSPAPRGIVCKRCGIQNSSDALSCEACESSLDMLDDILGEMDAFEEEPVDRSHQVLWGVLLLSGVFIGYRMYAALGAAQYGLATPYSVASSFREFMLIEHLNLGLALSGALLVAWPVCYILAQHGAGLHTIHTDKSVLLAEACAAFLVAFAWIPGVGLLEWVPVALATSLGAVVSSYRLIIKTAATIWAIQWLFLGILIVAVMGGIMGTGFLTNVVALDSFSREDPARSSLQIEQLSTEPITVQWASSGSSWLDEAALRAAMIVTVDQKGIEGDMTFVVEQGGKASIYERVSEKEHVFYLDTLRPGEPVTIYLMNSKGALVQLAITGVLPVSLL